MKNGLFNSILCVFLFCSLRAESQTSPNVLDFFYPPIERNKHFWLGADLLCFHPKEKSVVLTNEATNLATTTDVTLKPCIRPHFKWSVGYRLGFGYVLPNNKWDIAVNVSCLKSHMKQWRSIQEQTGFGMFPIWSLANDITPFDWVSQANMCWRLKLNLLDFGPIPKLAKAV